MWRKGKNKPYTSRKVKENLSNNSWWLKKREYRERYNIKHKGKWREVLSLIQIREPI